AHHNNGSVILSTHIIQSKVDSHPGAEHALRLPLLRGSHVYDSALIMQRALRRQQLLVAKLLRRDYHENLDTSQSLVRHHSSSRTLPCSPARQLSTRSGQTAGMILHFSPSTENREKHRYRTNRKGRFSQRQWRLTTCSISKHEGLDTLSGENRSQQRPRH